MIPIAISGIAALCLLSACGDGSDAHGNQEPAMDTSPLRVSLQKESWTIKDGGAASRDGPLVIDLEAGGWMRTDVYRRVYPKMTGTLDIRLDANGDQRLSVSLTGGCGRDIAERTINHEHLENGQNRVETRLKVEAAYTCLTVWLQAQQGPVSLTIEDAVITWEN